MAMIDRDLLYVLRDIRSRLGADLSLAALARRSGWSAFHLHRAFRRVARETPKQYTERIRLERAAAMLATRRHTVLAVALANGFASPEVFTRAFRRRFGCTPVKYRAAALASASPEQRERHAALVESVTPCRRLYRLSSALREESTTMPMLTIAREELAAQPILFVRRRVARHDLAKAIGECLGASFGLAMQKGYAIAGRPFARYPETSHGMLTLECGCVLASPAPGAGEVEAGHLQAGPAVVAMHAGSYDALQETFAAMEQWIEEQGLRTAGAPWESYITDPAEHPNTDDWRTQIFWPVAE